MSITVHALAEMRLTLEAFCKHLTDDSKVPVDMEDLTPEITSYINKIIKKEFTLNITKDSELNAVVKAKDKSNGIF